MSAKQANSSSLEFEQLTKKDANGHTPLVAALRNVSELHNLALHPIAQHFAKSHSSVTSDPASNQLVRSQRINDGPALTCDLRRP